MDLSFIALKSNTRPDADAIVRAAAEHGIELRPNEAEPPADDRTISLSVDDVDLIVAHVDAPHPDAASMPSGPTAPSPEDLAASPAHLVVAVRGLEGEPRQRDAAAALFTSFVLAGSDALGAVLAHGRYFHRAELFTGFSQLGVERDCVCAEISVGLSFAPEPDERMSILTHGLDRYGREEFFVTCPTQGKGAIELIYMLSNWMLVDPDKALPTGDTVGRTPEERLVVARVPSPIVDNPEVIRLDMP